MLAQAKLLLHQKQYAACTSTILRSDLKTSLRDIFSIANDLLAEQAWGPAADLYLFISSNSEDKKQVGEALLKLASTYENRLQPESSYTSLSGYFQGNQFLDLDLRISLNKDASLERTLKLYDSLQTLLPRTYEAFQASYHIANIQLMISGDVDRAIRGFDNIFEKAPKRDLRLAGGLRLVDAWLVRGDTTKAIEVLDTITSRLNMDEDDAPIIASRVKIRIHQGDIPALNKELLNLSGASSPLDPIFNDGLEIMALIEGNGEMDDSQLALYFKAEQFIQQHKLIEAVDVLTQTRGESTSIADEAHVRAINILLTLGDFEPAVKLMDSFLDSYPDSDWRPNVLIWKAEQLQFTDLKPQAAVPFYEEVIIHYPGYLGIQDVRTRLRGLLGAGS